MPSSRATAVTVLPEESTSAIASRLNSSGYRFVYLLPTWCYFLWNLTSQSPGVHDQGEGSVNEFAHSYGMRRCRYRGQGKAHIQHVLTAIAVNIERLSGLPSDEETPAPRRPTAFQDYLDQREIPRLKSWRTLGN